jgi:hypothetical protein
MMFIRLLALGLLFHEILNLGISGRTYFTRCFVPTFGLFLKPVQICIVHLTLMALCGILVVEPQWRVLYPFLFVLLTLIIASYSLRLSNHLVLAWFMALLLCLDLVFQRPVHWIGAPSPFVYAGVQMLIVMAYLLAFFHKLNADYLCSQCSCGAWLADLYIQIRSIPGKPAKRLLTWLAIYGTLVLELLIPLCLLSPRTRPFGLCLAVLLQLGLGLLVHVHFSVLMYAGLAAFIPAHEWPGLITTVFAHRAVTLVLFTLLGLCIGLRFGVWNGRGYRFPAVTLIQQMFFGVISVGGLAVGSALLHRGTLPADAWEHQNRIGFLAVIGAGFLFNGLCPYLGLKTNFSLAMFSNLRPDRWCHLIIPASWVKFRLATYVEVLSIEGLPDLNDQDDYSPAMVAITAFKQSSTIKYSSYFFHEGVQLLCQIIGPTQPISITYIEGNIRNDVSDYAVSCLSHPPCYLKLGLFPYTLPLDPGARHCD